MQIYAIDQTSFKAPKLAIRIHTRENQQYPMLYNKVSSIIERYHLPAVFHTDYIQLPNYNQFILNLLKRLKIVYDMIDLAEEEKKAQKAKEEQVAKVVQAAKAAIAAAQAAKAAQAEKAAQ